MPDFTSCLERIKSKTPISNQSQLAKILKVTTSNVTKRKHDNIFPEKWAFIVAQKYNLSTDWILTGKWPKAAGEKNKEDHFQDVSNTREFNEGYINSYDSISFDCYWNNELVKTVKIRTGNLYVIDPINPLRRKDRGLEVLLTEYSTEHGCEVLIEDLDDYPNKMRYFSIEPCDLKNI